MILNDEERNERNCLIFLNNFNASYSIFKSFGSLIFSVEIALLTYIIHIKWIHFRELSGEIKYKRSKIEEWIKIFLKFRI